ncbi:MAG: 3-dehydroquinate synthase [Bacteroidales bacterium]|nr:3-dehydroquinate synthase [Bacteroidales bacterium]
METVFDQQCAVHIGEGCLRAADEIPIRRQGRTCVLVCERHAAPLILPPLMENCPRLSKLPLYYLDASEPGKQIETLLPLWHEWARDGLDRHTSVILVGGGVLCDMGGFAASVYKRGIPFYAIPTTLLAMADASVGGKTAVDLGEIKNILGNFHRSEAVWIDPVFLKTLPRNEFLSGAAEILKMQFIGNPGLSFAELEKCLDPGTFPLSLLHFAIAEKARITGIDFYEENIRKTLNFGHTFGHAFEALALKQNRPIAHGQAVAHGMVCELYLSCLLAGCPKHLFVQTARLINRHYGIFRYGKEDIPELLGYMLNDKKNRNGQIFPVLLQDAGKSLYTESVGTDPLLQTLNTYPFNTDLD